MTAHGFKVIPTGIDHGTVTVVGKHGAYELTSLRRDVETDGRRAVVSFGESFQEDSLRRDFSFNAMYEDAEGKLYDYHNGLEDLKNRRIRFVGDAQTRIKEDYLRIMRLFRFWARFDYEPDAATLDVIAKTKQGLASVSVERVRTELLLLLEAEHPTSALRSMYELGVLSDILKDFSLEESIDNISSINTSKMKDIARLSYLLSDKDSAGFFKKLSKDLKLSQKQERCMVFLNTYDIPKSLEQSQIMDILDETDTKIFPGFFMEVALFYFKKVYPENTELWKHIQYVDTNKNHIRKAPALLNGQEILELSKMEKGPLLGKLVKDLKSRQRNEIISTKDEAIRFVKEYSSEK